METTLSALDTRSMSSFNLSIGTALALETLFTGTEPVYDPDRVIPDRIDILNYDELWINIGTLYRNIIGSVSSASQKTLRPGDIIHTLINEVETLCEIVNINTNNRVNIVFYHNEISGLVRKHPYAKLRVNTTENQRIATEMKQAVIKEFIKQHNSVSSKPHVLKEFSNTLKPTTRLNALILTNDAYDLLSYHNFNTLNLLESHTGVVKNKDMWYTKMTNGKELVRIPFNIATLQIFGDSNHFHPFPIAARTEILKIADNKNWTQKTTEERIKLGMENISDMFLKSVVTAMLKESI